VCFILKGNLSINFHHQPKRISLNQEINKNPNYKNEKLNIKKSIEINISGEKA
jgi:hypothetical protein